MPANLQKLVEYDGVPALAAVVWPPDEGGDHWKMTDGQLMIHVKTKNGQTPIWAHCCGGMRTGRGIWSIPDLKTEVVLLFDDGEVEGDAFIADTHGRLVGDLAPNVILIIDSSVEIRSINGTAHRLITKEQFDAHLHPTGVGPSGTPNNAATSGTTVLKAE